MVNSFNLLQFDDPRIYNVLIINKVVIAPRFIIELRSIRTMRLLLLPKQLSCCVRYWLIALIIIVVLKLKVILGDAHVCADPLRRVWAHMVIEDLGLVVLSQV